jgi:hypothetical protein
MPAAGLPSTGWLPPVTGPDGQVTQARVRWVADGQDVHELTHYRTTEPSGQVVEEVCCDTYHVVRADELRWLLTARSFTQDVALSGFPTAGGGPFYHEGDPMLVVVAHYHPERFSA